MKNWKTLLLGIRRWYRHDREYQFRCLQVVESSGRRHHGVVLERRRWLDAIGCFTLVRLANSCRMTPPCAIKSSKD